MCPRAPLCVGVGHTSPAFALLPNTTLACSRSVEGQTVLVVIFVFPLKGSCFEIAMFCYENPDRTSLSVKYTELFIVPFLFAMHWTVKSKANF